MSSHWDQVLTDGLWMAMPMAEADGAVQSNIKQQELAGLCHLCLHGGRRGFGGSLRCGGQIKLVDSSLMRSSSRRVNVQGQNSHGHALPLILHEIRHPARVSLYRAGLPHDSPSPMCGTPKHTCLLCQAIMHRSASALVATGLLTCAALLAGLLSRAAVISARAVSSRTPSRSLHHEPLTHTAA